MNITVQLLFLFITGIGAGFFYFGGLMLTIRYLRFRQKQGAFLMGSFVLRTGLLIVLLFLVSDGHWQRLAVSIAGFLSARQLMMILWSPAKSSRARQEGGRGWIS